MALENLQRLSAGLTLLLASGFVMAAPGSDLTKTQSGTTAVKITYKVFVSESGQPKSAKLVSVEPAIKPSSQASLDKATLQALMTWTFTPNQEHGKPVAGYVVVPVILDLADPVQ